VATDEELEATAAVVEPAGREPVRVDRSLGSPGRPLSPAQVGEKARRLGAAALDGALDDLDAPAAMLLERLARPVLSRS
jgi:hypothetical protein